MHRVATGQMAGVLKAECNFQNQTKAMAMTAAEMAAGEVAEASEVAEGERDR